MTEDDYHISAGFGTFHEICPYKEDAELCQKLIKILINHCGETGKNEGAVDTLKRKLEDSEKLERVDSLFAELEIPLPYDLWLAESLQIRERLKKRIEELDKQIQYEFDVQNNVDAEGEVILKELQEIEGIK